MNFATRSQRKIANARDRRAQVEARPFSLDAARIAYISKPNRLKLSVLLRDFASAPVEVETSGQTDK